jgi:tetratricopeptide (TPR) repeat protein
MSVRSPLWITFARFIGAAFLVRFLAVLVSAQQSPSPNAPFPPFNDPFNDITRTTTTMRAPDNRNAGTIVLLSVYAEDGKTRLDRQSIVKITNQIAGTVNWQTTNEKSEAKLDLPFGKYDFEISAVGYLSEHKELQAAETAAHTAIPIDVSLHRDPTEADLNITEAAMPAKALKEVKGGVSALKSGNFKDARKRLDAAYKMAPSNPDLNYLLGYLFYQQKDVGQARSYLLTACRLDAHNVQSSTLLGRVELVQEDYVAAASTLESAVRADPDYWMAHNLLADVYLKQKKYEEARQQAELSIEKGKQKANTSNLALGLALVSLGKTEDGVQVLRVFVQDSPNNPAVPQVRDLIAAIAAREREPVHDVAARTAPRNATPLSGVDPLLASPEIPISVKPWQPPGIDEFKPTVAAGVGCPYAQVIEMSGERVTELVDDVSRIAAIEHLVHERVDEMGNPASRETRDYNYVASIAEETPGFLGVDEYRSERLQRADYVDGISTNGFAALALIFHPDMRDNFEMTCEGLGRWHEQAAWLVHFNQRQDRPARFQDYKVGGVVYAMQLKGRAWITADKFQIVRIEAELLSPVSNIQLRSERQVVEYSPVQFRQKNVELWLPKTAEIYLDFRKRRYFRTHTFDHYMLFSVDSAEKRNEPKAPPAGSTEKPLPN